MPLLRQTAALRGTPTRVTFVSSYSHADHTLETNPIAPDESVISHFDNSQTPFRGTRYQDAKLVVTAYVQFLATRLLPSEVIVNCVCPGIVATNITSQLPLWVRLILYVYFKLKARPVGEGVRVLIYAAVIVGAESHGKFVKASEMDR